MLLSFAVGALTGILSGCGVGGGTLLIVYLTLVAGVDQYAAGGINLLYFIGCAPAALLSHARNHLIDMQAVFWCAFAGVLTSTAAAVLGAGLDGTLLRRLFGVLLLSIGVREIFAKKE